ncbi:MAG: sigma-70 family RNA polymerase sigma factor [Lachnospiraceae bacterium]|nr:sigma-70 family RNA polymerase sigma factor [Lachnospiraceae bacterium]
MTDEAAIKRIRSGDEKAIAALMDKYSRMLWKVTSSILAPFETEIEECVADVFIRLWQKPESYDAKRGRLSTWLCTMAKSMALDRLRRIIARREDPVEQLPELMTQAAEYESEGELEPYLEQLSEEEREILKRRYYHGQKVAEIAKDMGMDKKKVENRLFRSRKKLKMIMDDTNAY